MSNYQRILIPIDSISRGEVLLKRTAALVQSERAEVRVVKVIDSRAGFDSDGPAGTLPMERAARKKPGARKQLELMLARSALSWAQADVIHGEPIPALAEAITRWRPDLVIAATTLLLPSWVAYAVAQSGSVRPDMLTVNCGTLFSRLAQTLFPYAAPQSRRGEAIP